MSTTTVCSYIGTTAPGTNVPSLMQLSAEKLYENTPLADLLMKEESLKDQEIRDRMSTFPRHMYNTFAEKGLNRLSESMYELKEDGKPIFRPGLLETKKQILFVLYEVLLKSTGEQQLAFLTILSQFSKPAAGQMVDKASMQAYHSRVRENYKDEIKIVRPQFIKERNDLVEQYERLMEE